MVKIPYNIITEYTSEEFMTNFKAEFYENGDEIPVKEFLDSLDDKMRAKFSMEIKLLEAKLLNLNSPNLNKQNPQLIATHI